MGGCWKDQLLPTGLASDLPFVGAGVGSMLT